MFKIGLLYKIYEMIVFLLLISIGVNVYLILRMIKVNHILSEIKKLDEFVKQEKAKTEKLTFDLTKFNPFT